MASEVFSGTSNPSYTNTTGKNVRLVINSLKNCVSFSFGSSGTVNVSSLINISQLGDISTGSVGSSGTYGPQFTASVTTNPSSSSYGWYTRSGASESTPFSGIRQAVIRYNNVTIFDGTSGFPTVINNEYVVINNIRYAPKTYRGSVYGWSGDYSNAFDIVAGALDVNVLKEIFLGPNETFTASCGAYNILIIKEDGT